MASEDQDLRILDGISRRDDQALRELYRCHGRRMFAHAFGILGDRFLAEDAVQESLIAVWEGAASFRGRGRVIAWLLGIVHHKAIDLLRKRKTVLPLETEQDEPAREKGPEERASGTEYRRIVRRCLAELPLPQRMTLDLVFYQGLQLEEAARILGVPVGTVKSRLHQAKDRLRKILTRAGWKAEDLR